VLPHPETHTHTQTHTHTHTHTHTCATTSGTPLAPWNREISRALPCANGGCADMSWIWFRNVGPKGSNAMATGAGVCNGACMLCTVSCTVFAGVCYVAPVLSNVCCVLWSFLHSVCRSLLRGTSVMLCFLCFADSLAQFLQEPAMWHQWCAVFPVFCRLSCTVFAGVCYVAPVLCNVCCVLWSFSHSFCRSLLRGTSVVQCFPCFVDSLAQYLQVSAAWHQCCAVFAVFCGASYTVFAVSATWHQCCAVFAVFCRLSCTVFAGACYVAPVVCSVCCVLQTLLHSICRCLLRGTSVEQCLLCFVELLTQFLQEPATWHQCCAVFPVFCRLFCTVFAGVCYVAPVLCSVSCVLQNLLHSFCRSLLRGTSVEQCLLCFVELLTQFLQEFATWHQC